MYLSTSILLIINLFVHVVIVQSMCNLDNLTDCCNTEGKANATTFLINKPKGIKAQNVTDHFKNLCKFRTLYEQQSFITEQYQKLASIDIATLFTTTTTTPKTTRPPTTRTPKTTPKQPTLLTTSKSPSLTES
ncbi:hypothetical protein KSF78_0000856 [Schistosoma japonicum]|uniref:Uncharacterized protein n=1 Tax=Schistosoma japonicum TaxID=6182 RepID=C1LR70_SCHJA|nr:hypothetical protein KSF78_0000856 [Schistosoma japonicum]CAX77194.1 hypothetical protein [Schistosoma japonicum]CAX77198.1 hypothetical protein [Schistosoma japonicum]CAX77199.1 hypothetical protein [Schistosoma japonicum]